jgi:polyisoprenoid-binding protein YceI
MHPSRPGCKRIHEDLHGPETTIGVECCCRIYRSSPSEPNRYGTTRVDIAPVAAYSYLASVNNFALPAPDPSSNSKPAPAQRLLTSRKVRLNRATNRLHGSLSNRQPFGARKGSAESQLRAFCEEDTTELLHAVDKDFCVLRVGTNLTKRKNQKQRGTTMLNKVLRISKRLPLALMVIGLSLLAVSSAQVRSIDTAQSKLHVHAYKSGLFSGFADNHDVEAPIVEGTIDESASRVRFVVDARQMRVLDPQLSPDKRRQVQERMLGPEVLDSTNFPQIKFESANVEKSGQDELLVGGQLSLRGITHPVSVKVRKENGRYVGSCTLKQRDFGIKPISIAGGTVKVKDELKIEFDIRTNTRIASK